EWDGALVSGQQRKLTLKLANAAPYTTTGQLDVTFRAASGPKTDDPAVVFLESGGRTLVFGVTKGSTTVTLNGAANASLQTGTTAGTLSFKFSGVSQGFAGDPNSTASIPPAQLYLDRALATRIPGLLRVDLIGYDNTYSVGSMQF